MASRQTGSGWEASPEGQRERARMGRIAGGLWTLAALVTVAASFLPGASHENLAWVLALAAVVLVYGVASITGLMPWQRASLGALALGMAVTNPVVGLALYLSGGSLSYVEPFLVCSLLYAGFFFPARWAWTLTVELLLVAGTPLIYDERAVENAFPSRYAALVAAFLAVTAVTIRVKRRLVEAEERQRRFANRDDLTGLANRRAFDRALRRELSARSGRGRGGRRVGDGSVALLLFDLDGFKAVNDRHGHPVGDDVLRGVGRRVETALRATDTVARLGGDEFAVIAPGADRGGADRLTALIATAVATGDDSGSLPAVGATIGSAVFPEDGIDAVELVRLADTRLLDHKGRRGISIPGAEVALGRPAIRSGGESRTD